MSLFLSLSLSGGARVCMSARMLHVCARSERSRAVPTSGGSVGCVSGRPALPPPPPLPFSPSVSCASALREREHATEAADRCARVRAPASLLAARTSAAERCGVEQRGAADGKPRAERQPLELPGRGQQDAEESARGAEGRLQGFLHADDRAAGRGRADALLHHLRHREVEAPEAEARDANTSPPRAGDLCWDRIYIYIYMGGGAMTPHVGSQKQVLGL